MCDGGLNVLTQQRFQVDAVVGEEVFKRGLTGVLKSRREPLAVLGEIDGQRQRVGIFKLQAVGKDRPDVRGVHVVVVFAE